MPRVIRPVYEDTTSIMVAEQLHFNDSQIQELNSCLSKDLGADDIHEAIDSLLLICRIVKCDIDHHNSAPPPKAVEVAMERICNMAFDLARSLRYMDRVTKKIIEDGLNEEIVGPNILEFAKQLDALGCHAATRLARGVDPHKKPGKEVYIESVVSQRYSNKNS